jgi:hypothetical protein
MIPKECRRLAEVDFPIAVVKQARGTGEVHPLWAPLNAASLVGTATARGMSGDTPWTITPRSP